MEEVVPQVEDEGAFPQEAPGHVHRVGQPLGFLLKDVADGVTLEGHLQVPLRLRGDHDPDLPDPGLQEVLHGVVDDGPPRHPDGGLGAGVGQGTEPRAPSRGQDEPFHALKHTP